jgi:hypothetical protein
MMLCIFTQFKKFKWWPCTGQEKFNGKTRFLKIHVTARDKISRTFIVSIQPVLSFLLLPFNLLCNV